MTKNSQKNQQRLDPSAIEEPKKRRWLRLWYRLGVCFRREIPRPREKTRPTKPAPARAANPYVPVLAIGMCVMASLALIVVVFVHIATANADIQAEVADERTEDESPNLDEPLYNEAERDPDRRPAPPRNYFTLHPADPGALAYDDLNDAGKAELEETLRWAELDHGDAVHAAFSGLARKRSRKARAETAERAIGLEGLAAIGVMP